MPELEDELREAAERAKERKELAPVSLSMAVLAVLVATVTLLGHRAHTEEILLQNKATDQWNYYQAKSIKAAVLDSKTAVIGARDGSDESKRARYEKEQEEIKSEAERKQAAAKSYFHKHEVFARGVTMFQIAIAIAAISALTKKRSFWVVSLVFGAFGCAFLVLAAMGR